MLEYFDGMTSAAIFRASRPSRFMVAPLSVGLVDELVFKVLHVDCDPAWRGSRNTEPGFMGLPRVANPV